MKRKNFTSKAHRTLLIIALLLGTVLLPGFQQQANCAPAFQISGYYLGETSDDAGVEVEVDPLVEEKYYEVETSDERLFFIKIEETLRLYRIVKEQPIDPNKVRIVLDNLKAKYGTPDKQQIKTSGVRPRNKRNYTTTVKNKAMWNISETQEFIAEIESRRVVYELIDHNPEHIKAPEKTDGAADEGFSGEGWNPDY